MTSSSVPDTANPQRAYFLALVFGAAAAVAYMFCVQPAQTSLSRAKQELENLQQRQGVALRDIRGAQQFKARLEELERARKPYAEGLLTPVLESYAMGARARWSPPEARARCWLAECCASAAFRALSGRRWRRWCRARRSRGC